VRRTVAAILLGHVLLTGGCLVVTTATVVGEVASTAVTTAGKVTVATVRTSGRLAASAVSSSGEVVALSLESAARLARTGAVVAVDAGSGAVAELPWQEGMRLSLAAQNGQLSGGYRTARIFRRDHVIPANLPVPGRNGADQLLFSGDVVELHR
jgi:hypothetical protein